uniref:NADH-ubiquinone oxidoreductase chain 1 n=1 Tax=Halocynthia spinosa TaxID=569430 RepID=S0DGU7_HALSF|nr:NADH dehydrogenase subunit 1 [Halocynthia spinosa]CCO25768.1 NADH dehydrogenase subunit 1 [Halocynthia spinosa]
MSGLLVWVLVCLVVVLFNMLALGYFLFLVLMVAFLVLLERKFLGLTQIRMGPNLVGVWGTVQTVADGLKLLMKRFFVSGKVNFFFFFCPILGFFMGLLHWVVLPFWGGFLGVDFSILYTFAVSGLLVYIVIWAGWGSDSLYGFIGGVRGVSQMISYEVVFMFFLLCFLFVLGGYGWEMFYYFGWEMIFFKGVLFGYWGVIVLAELNRVPFDLVEGESELVSGFNVEYAGFGFTLLFLFEYMNIWFMGFLSMLVFIGSVSLWGVLGSVFVFVGLVLYVRCVLPRFKFTQLIDLMWKMMLPGVFFMLVWGSIYLG